MLTDLTEKEERPFIRRPRLSKKSMQDAWQRSLARHLFCELQLVLCRRTDHRSFQQTQIL